MKNFPFAQTKVFIMRFLASLLFSIIVTTQAGAQTAEEAAAAAANAAFNVIEESLISDFFKSTGLKPKELKVLLNGLSSSSKLYG